VARSDDSFRWLTQRIAIRWRLARNALRDCVLEELPSRRLSRSSHRLAIRGAEARRGNLKSRRILSNEQRESIGSQLSAAPEKRVWFVREPNDPPSTKPRTGQDC
jgi:hypothetical protein